MNVFLCYASEQVGLAQRIALALQGIGVDVFFDRDKLGAGDEFNFAIRRAVLACDLFLFVASHHAVANGAYTLTELGLAQRRWPNPAQRVMTVVADDTPIAELPPYLSAVSVLRPTGDRVAETLDAVARWRERRRRRVFVVAGGAAALLTASALAAWWFAFAPAPPVAATDEDIDDGVPNPRVHRLKNGHQVRMAGSVLRNDSNVAERILRKYIEWDAWRYNQCYDEHFGHLAGALPEGHVDIGFEIIDQLPRHGSVVQSSFEPPGFAACVESTLLGQTLNAAGSQGAGKVVYRFRFLPS
jgi:hypothetical protein